MANNIDLNHYFTGFTQTIEMMLHQSGMRLRPYVSYKSYKGEKSSVVDQIDEIPVLRNRGRNTDTPTFNIEGRRRFVAPTTLTTATMVDRIDDLKVLIDPKGTYTMAISEAMGRAVDDEIGAAFFRPSLVGKDGQGSIAFPNTQVVGVDVGGVGSGLNVPKLRAAKRLFMKTGLDLARERLYMAITSVEHDNLLGELQVTNMDYNDKPTLVDGRVTSFMGFNFVHVEWQATAGTINPVAAYPESLPYVAPGGLASSVRQLPCWVTSGMHLGDWESMQTKVDERWDKNYATQLWAEATMGATRLEERKVVQIICNSL